MKTEIYKHIEVLVNRYPVLNSVKDEIVEAYFLLVESYKNEGKLLIAGNGGSAADAEHIVGELMKGFKLPRKLNENFTDKLISENEELGTVLAESLQGALPAIALDGHPALSTAYMNISSNFLCTHPYGWPFSLIPLTVHTAKCFLMLSYPITPTIILPLFYTVEPCIPCNDVFSKC